MLGFAAQAAVTHEGPFANLQTHLVRPTRRPLSLARARRRCCYG